MYRSKLLFMLEIPPYLTYLMIGTLGGFLGGLLGVGGGVVILPLLIFMLGVPTDLAIGINITSVIFTAISGTIAHLKMKNVRPRIAAYVLLGGIAGAVTGSLLFNIIHETYKRILDLLLGTVFLYISAKLMQDIIKKKEQVNNCRENIPTIMSYGFITGIVAGLLGIGGGFILVPVFLYKLCMNIREAVGTSLASWLAIATTSAIFKIVTGTVNVITALSVGAGAVLGAQIGARALTRTPHRILKIVFSIILLCMSIKLIAISIT